MAKKTHRTPKSAATAAINAKAAVPSRRQPLRTKKQIALSLLERPKGASIAEMQTAMGCVSRASPVQTALRNCTRDEGGPFGFGDQELFSDVP